MAFFFVLFCFDEIVSSFRAAGGTSWLGSLGLPNYDSMAAARRGAPQWNDYGLHGTLSPARLRRQQPLVLPQHNKRSKNYNKKFLFFYFAHNLFFVCVLFQQNQRNYLIEDLITWKDYEIQMAAFNRIDVGKFSKSITVKTREGSMNQKTA